MQYFDRHILLKNMLVLYVMIHETILFLQDFDDNKIVSLGIFS